MRQPSSTDQTASSSRNLEAILTQQQQEIETLRSQLAKLDPNFRGEEESINVNNNNIREIVNERNDVIERVLEKKWTYARDVKRVQDLAVEICGDGAEECVLGFFEGVECWRGKVGRRWEQRDGELDENWYEEPWYCVYVQYWGTEEDGVDGDFEKARAMLGYLEELGFRNLYVLPHYESTDGDGGYDVKEYVPRRCWGGEKGWLRFLEEANGRGMRVATDAVCNHTSTEHDWFQKALSGEEKYIDYYVQRNGREKIAEIDRDGDIVCRYRDPDGTITERVVVFPNVDRTHGLWVEINGKSYQFYRAFYPFQVDLNLQNPNVLKELFNLLGRELSEGVLGKRFDAIAHWVVKPGHASEGLPETHAVQALLKLFMRHISPHAVAIPEVVSSMDVVSQYAGKETITLNRKCSSEGDAVLSFEMQAALREMTYFQTVAPFWQRVFRTPRLPDGAIWINLLEHHDETYMGFFPLEVRQWIIEYIESRRGVVYRNGMSAGGRYADCLDNDEDRIATAIFALYMSPGTPFVYFGVEIGWGNNHDHAKKQMIKSREIFESLGVFVPEGACYDPRELQRGPIPRSAFLKVRDENYLPWCTLKRLNELRRERRSARSQDVHPIDSGDIGILCLARYGGRDWKGRNNGNGGSDSDGVSGRVDEDTCTALLCMANLTPFEKTALMPVWQVSQRLRIRCDENTQILKMKDLLSERSFEAVREDTSFSMKLERFGRYMLEVDMNA